MQVEVDVKCMQTNFGGPGLSGFGDFALFHLPSKRPKFPFGPWTIHVVHGGQKIESAQKIYASRGACTLISLVGMAIPVLEIFAVFFL